MDKVVDILNIGSVTLKDGQCMHRPSCTTYFFLLSIYITSNQAAEIQAQTSQSVQIPSSSAALHGHSPSSILRPPAPLFYFTAPFIPFIISVGK